MITDGILAYRRCKEVARDESCSLVQQLVEGVLTIGSRFTPHHRAGLVKATNAVRDVRSTEKLGRALRDKLVARAVEAKAAHAGLEPGLGHRADDH